jgi:hypothetical protein
MSKIMMIIFNSSYEKAPQIAAEELLAIPIKRHFLVKC